MIIFYSILVLSFAFVSWAIYSTRKMSWYDRFSKADATFTLILALAINIGFNMMLSVGVYTWVVDDGPMIPTKSVIKLDDPLNIIDGKAVVYYQDNTIWTPEYVALKQIKYVEHGKEVYKLVEEEDMTDKTSKWIWADRTQTEKVTYYLPKDILVNMVNTDDD